MANTANTNLVWGPWHFTGALGIFINVFACMYLTLVLFFSFWPPYTPTTAADMNYSSVLMAFVILFSVVYYLLFARKTYKGPIIETDMHSVSSTDY